MNDLDRYTNKIYEYLYNETEHIISYIMKLYININILKFQFID